ncbi:MAG: elongation factor Tu [Methanomicrobiales archaeon]|nr:elongation factor Tu [Methanomicrobiales archaeon]
MGNLNIAILGAPDYAAKLGKKGTISDITLFNVRRGDDTLTLIEPSRYPERLSSLFYAVSLADLAVLVVDEINSPLGEMILMLQAVGVREGFIILRQYIAPDLVKSLIKGTVVEYYRIFEDNPVSLRELLLEEAATRTLSSPSQQVDRQACSVSVDHFFPVRGIGVVILGKVVRGTVLRHDALTVLPRGLSVLVRSIQKHDDDVDWAGEGDRVGLALKNIELEDLNRGDVLTNDTSLSTSSTLSTEAMLFPYWQQPVKAGMVVHIGHWMQFIPTRVLSAEQGTGPHQYRLSLLMESPLVHPPGGSAVLCYLDGKKLRVMGTISLPERRIIDQSPIQQEKRT